LTAEALVARLEYCKSTRAGQWIARCPAHADKSPSLSIKEISDGRVLIHCHAGCTGLDVLSAVGMNWSDLYPPDMYPPNHNYKSVNGKRSSGPEVSELTLAIGRSAIKEGLRLSESEKNEMRSAFIASHRD